MSLIPRPITPADAAAIAALIRAAFAVQSAPTDPAPSALRETTETVAAFLAKGGGGAMITRDARLLGAVLWEEKEGGLYFGRLAVDPAHRGHGIARALIEAAEQEAMRRRLPRIHLSVRLKLCDNRRLFASCGFVETTQSAHPGYTAPTSVAMEKWLPRNP